MEESKTNTPEKEGERKLPIKYIKQPYPLTAMQADLTLQQLHVLVGMMQSIQDGVQELFSRSRSGEPRIMFAGEQGDYVHIEFRFSDVTKRPDAYRDVEKVASEFFNIAFRYEDKERGEVTLAHFVDEVTYPSKGSKRDRIHFRFTREQAQTVFNFTKYSKYMLPVAQSIASRYTLRLYILITSARGFDRGHTGVFHWFATYTELRRIFGCDVKNARGQWERKKRAQYKHFKADILRVAEKELRALADEGRSDCWFEFRELPENFRGEPERFDFIVHLSELGISEERRAFSLTRYGGLQKTLMERMDLTEGDTYAVLSQVDDTFIEQFTVRVEEIAAAIERQGGQIRSRRKYAMKSLTEALREFTPASGEDGAGEVRAEPDSGAAGAAEPTEEEMQWWGRVHDHFAGTPTAAAMEGMTLRRGAGGLYIEVSGGAFLEAFAGDVRNVTEYTGLDVRTRM